MKLNYIVLTTLLLFQNYNSKAQNTSLSSYDDILNLIFRTNLTSISPLNNDSLVSTTTLRTKRTTTVSTTTTTNSPTNRPPPQIPENYNHTASYEKCGENKICVPFFLCNYGTDTLNTNGEYVIDIRIDDNKSCAPYLEKCCHVNDKTPETAVVTPKSTDNEAIKQGCGHRNVDGILFRIIGASEGETEYGEFPWMIAVLREDTVFDEILIIYKCGASLIHPSVVLTAAHCIYHYDKKDLIVRAGEWDTQTKDELFSEQDRRISDIIVHEKFNKANLNYDIALLITTEPFKLGSDVNTICLPPPNTNFDDIGRCYATGWGKDVFGKEGKYQVIMKKIDLPMIPFPICQEKLRKTRLGHQFSLHASFVCAGGEVGKDTCRGDGGGPLACPIPGQKFRYYQTGIIAWGIGCGSENPGVYGNVAFLRNWIDNVFTNKKLEKSYYIPSQ